MGSGTASTSPSLWRRPNYVRLWGSVTAANLGDGIALAAAPLAVAAITTDPLLVSGVVVAQRLPWVIFAPFAGVLVDRSDRRVLLLVANVLRAAGMGCFALALAAGFEEIVLLYAAVFALGMGETLADNASLAMIPRLVERDQLERANGRIFAAMPIANELLGPPLGAWLFALGAATAFGAAGAAFATAALLAAAIAATFRSDIDTTAASVTADLIEGLRWFIGHHIVRVAALWAGLYNLFGAATTGVLVLYAQTRLGLTDEQFGLFLAAGAVGGIVGGWAADRVMHALGPGAALLLGNIAAAASYAVLATTAEPLLAAAALSFGSLSAMLGNVVAYTLRQTVVPDRLLGRVTAAYRLVALGALPLGGLIGGLSAREWGIVGPFWIAAVGTGLLALAVAPVLNNSNIRSAQAQAA